jgi:hypothetical protein
VYIGNPEVTFELLLEVLQFRERFLPFDHPDLDATIGRLHELLADHPEFEQLSEKEMSLFRHADIRTQIDRIKQMARVPVLGTYPSNEEMYQLQEHEQMLIEKMRSPCVPNDLPCDIQYAENSALNRFGSYVSTETDCGRLIDTIAEAFKAIEIKSDDLFDKSIVTDFSQIDTKMSVYPRKDSYRVRFECNGAIGGVQIYTTKTHDLVFEFFRTSGDSSRILIDRIFLLTTKLLYEQGCIKSTYHDKIQSELYEATEKKLGVKLPQW